VIVAQTDRLVVRYLRLDDLDDFAALTSDPDVVRYMDEGRPLTREQTERWLGITLENYRVRGYGCFGITDRTSDRLIGFGGFARPPDRPGTVELIYALAPHAWGRGLATEAGRAIIEFGFSSCGLRRIEATVDPVNEPSKRVLEKIGMTYDGRRAEDDGSETDYFSIERDPSPA
jgi:RimJ/RimL family protein N-acetyltransferase